MPSSSPHFKLISKQNNKILNLYQNQLYQQQVMLGIIKSALPDALKEQARYCVVARQRVFVYTTSAAWASQLRFHTHAMLEGLQRWRSQANIEGVQIRLLTLDSTSTKYARQPNMPSKSMIKLIRDVRGQQQDVLSEALTALSKTLEKLNESVKQGE